MKKIKLSIELSIVECVLYFLVLSMLIGYLQFRTTSIEQIKEFNYLGKTVIVEGDFMRDSVPMLVTDRDITLINTPMSYNQYVLLVGNKTKYMPTRTFGSLKLRVKGKVFPGYCGCEDEVVIEVFRYTLAPSAWQYIQDRGTKMMDDGHISRPRIRRKSYVVGNYKSIRIRGSRVNTWLKYLVWEMYK